MSICPPCPKCAGIMRLMESDDAQCRCGFTVSGEALLATRELAPDELAIALLAAGRMVSPPDAKPGIHISEHYGDLTAMCWDPRRAAMGDLVAATSAADNALFMRDEAIKRGRARGLVFEHDKARGPYLSVYDGAVRHDLRRQRLYALAPFGQQIEAARQVVDRIAHLRGPGRWWSLLDPVHVIGDDGRIKVADVGGVPHVFMRAFYCHLPICPLCGEPCDRVEVGGVTLNGCPCVGSKDRAMAIDYSKIKKDPASSGFFYKTIAKMPAPLPYRVKYEPIAIDKAALDEALKQTSVFHDAIARETDKMIRDQIAALDRKLEAKYAEKYGAGAASRHRAVLEAAQAGAITAEQARELLEMPAVEPPAPDPLDVEYDGWPLRDWLRRDQNLRREEGG